MVNKVMISLKIPQTLEQHVAEKVIGDGYGMRGKSRWIEEAIENFFLLPDYPEMVDIATDMSGLTKTISVRISENLAHTIDQSMLHVREEYPMMEGVKSNIIRASILQRLLRKASSVTEHSFK